MAPSDDLSPIAREFAARCEPCILGTTLEAAE
jgi:hypothetical protein